MLSLDLFHLDSLDVSGCNIGEHQCDSGECLDNSFICNQIVDCPNDNSDERNCPAPGEIIYNEFYFSSLVITP